MRRECECETMVVTKAEAISCAPSPSSDRRRTSPSPSQAFPHHKTVAPSTRFLPRDFPLALRKPNAPSADVAIAVASLSPS
ncbi:hypothetical protein KSP40_PGU001024 [Platanthera guangdongensis]|uniref:Uncharacterized protein n=1 Tax=Platanthera guangdongensis TaxID=2320717 RepID=A0ABR2MT87_9ASPA